MADSDHHHDEDMDFEEDLEAYCVSCKQKAMIEDPQPVWTKRGAPGTRGYCEICGTAVFRMGKTAAHEDLKKPKIKGLKDIPGTSRSSWGGESDYSTYINYTRPDARLAERLAEDLAKIGVPAWVDPEPNGGDDVAWAGGVHPALDDCKHMVVVLSEDALNSEQVEQAWSYFRRENKPVVVAMKERVEVPDDLRRRPRFDFSNDDEYKRAFRELVDALS